MARSGGSASAAELLARLGLSDGASESDIESAHADVVAFLAGAPADLRPWARTQIAAADQAYAQLFDPEVAAQPARLASSVPAEPTRPSTAAQLKRARRATIATPPVASPRRIGPLARVLLGAAAVIGVLGAGYVVYASDLPSVPGLTGTPVPASTQTTIDTARVAQLMQAIQANPNDTAALQELATIYFDAGQYVAAADWENSILAIEPNNVLAHLALGAAQYNLGNSADAEAHWRKVIDLNPADVNLVAEAHYDLGFMYFSAVPPDVARTIVEWQTVIDIAPNSDIAQTVMAHLPQLQGANGSASPNASASPRSSASPAATPAPSGTNGG